MDQVERGPQERSQRTPQANRHPGSPTASECLRQQSDRIKALWEWRVREQIVESRDSTSLALLDSFPELLDRMAKVLDPEDPTMDATVGNLYSQTHGGERALVANYYLPQLLKEFSILRQVIFEVLHDEEMLTHEGRNAIDRSIDSAISLAATEFSRIQSSSTRAALAKAEASNRDLEQFAAVAAHDLKSPLATISGYMTLIEDDYKDQLGEEGMEYVRVVHATMDRMRSLIDRLLDYARLVEPERPFQRIETGEAMAAARQNLEDMIERCDAIVESGRLPAVLGDKDLLTQLFQNLVANSLKFRSDRPPVIRVHASETNGNWLFSVQDNGIGFEPVHNEDIFSLFTKLHGASEYSGAGIGLATCRKVVELHGGKIWAESAPGRGATFFFTIPRLLPVDPFQR